MKAYGNDQNITPFLDSLAQQSLLLLISMLLGTEQRGLEAVTVAPTAGESVVKRKTIKTNSQQEVCLKRKDIM
jgi:hypothetical protein